MSHENQNCPQCNSSYSYQDIDLWICPECAYEWIIENEDHPTKDEATVDSFLDAHGVQLQDGDTVRTIKDLKIGRSTLKSGTKVKGIKLLDDPVNGHDISCKVDGLGAVYLKCSVVKKE